MKMYSPIYFFAAVFIIVFTIYAAGGSYGLFINPPSLFITVILSGILLLGAFSPIEIFSYFAAAFRKKTDDTKTIKHALNFFDTLQRYLLFSAFVGVIVGIISMLVNLEDPEALGPGTAVCLLTLFYSLTLILIIVAPFRAGLKKRLIEHGEMQEL
ncbi:MotA/TolQ/ExbB proton channel family protein [candidate division KSB1 bacterium]